MNFFRGWEAYRDGFGKLTGEHWLGAWGVLCKQVNQCTPMVKPRHPDGQANAHSGQNSAPNG